MRNPMTPSSSSRNVPENQGGKGILIAENKSYTLSTMTDESICYELPDANGGGVQARYFESMSMKEENIQPSITANGCGAVCYPIACDARGNMTNDGTITATLTGDHQNRITDYTTIVVVPNETD